MCTAARAHSLIVNGDRAKRREREKKKHQHQIVETFKMCLCFFLFHFTLNLNPFRGFLIFLARYRLATACCRSLSKIVYQHCDRSVLNTSRRNDFKQFPLNNVFLSIGRAIESCFRLIIGNCMRPTAKNDTKEDEKKREKKERNKNR